MTADIVDLNAKRLAKAVSDSAVAVLPGPAPAGATLVAVLGCIACGSTEFRLAHGDPTTGACENLVLCARCSVQIRSLRWYDVDQPAPTG